METEQSGQLHGKFNVGEPHNYQLITNEPIEDTPFRLIGNPTNGYAIAIGMHRLTEPKPTIEKAKEVLLNVQWNLIANMIVAITETYRLVQEEEAK